MSRVSHFADLLDHQISKIHYEVYTYFEEISETQRENIFAEYPTILELANSLEKQSLPYELIQFSFGCGDLVVVVRNPHKESLEVKKFRVDTLDFLTKLIENNIPVYSSDVIWGEPEIRHSLYPLKE